MEEQARRRFAAIATTVIGIAYFFVCALPLPKVLHLKPVWGAAILPTEAHEGLSPPSDTVPRPFSIGDIFGYFDSARGITLAVRRSYAVALSEGGYAAYERLAESITWRDPRGAAQAVTRQVGYPFVAGGRRFLLAPNQSTVSEIDGKGEVAWTRDFPAILTAFDACPSMALFGTLDGRLVGLSPGGEVLLDFAPGGSRIEGIFGCAVSPDGRTLGAICGLDKQRLVVLEFRDEAFRVAWHRWLDSDFRRPVAMAFSGTGEELLYESTQGLGIYEVSRRAEHLLATQLGWGLGRTMPSRRILLALEAGGAPSLAVASLDGRRLFTFGFDAREASLASDERSVFLTLGRDGDPRLLRLDFGEE